MKRLSVSLAILLAAGGLVLAGCGQAAPPPTPTTAPKPAAPTQAPAAATKAPAAPTQAAAAPTKAPAAPTKAAEPTKAAAPAQAPTAAPAKKVDFPQKGKVITIIVPFAAGGPTDIQARMTAQYMEKDLDATVEVVNKVGAGGQLGTGEMVKSKPDGYTLATTPLPTTLQVYLDPARKNPYSRKDFAPISDQVSDPGTLAVKADSPFKEVKDVVDAAKAKPETFKLATVGAMTNSHMWAVMLERLTGAKFALVHFDGAAPAQNALLGGHVDAIIQAMGNQVALTRAGQTRVLGLMTKEGSKFFPGVRTFEAQGYKLYVDSTTGYSAPGGTPKEIVDVLDAAIKKVTQNPEFAAKNEEMGKTLYYRNPTEYAAFWDTMEAETKLLMPLLVTK